MKWRFHLPYLRYIVLEEDDYWNNDYWTKITTSRLKFFQTIVRVGGYWGSEDRGDSDRGLVRRVNEDSYIEKVGDEKMREKIREKSYELSVAADEDMRLAKEYYGTRSRIERYVKTKGPWKPWKYKEIRIEREMQRNDEKRDKLRKDIYDLIDKVNEEANVEKERENTRMGKEPYKPIGEINKKETLTKEEEIKIELKNLRRELEEFNKKPLVEEKPEKAIIPQDINNKLKVLAEEILTAYKPLEGILAHDINAFYNKKGAISGKIDNLHKYITSRLDELINKKILFKDGDSVSLTEKLEKDEKTTLKKIIYFKVETDRIKEIISSEEMLQTAGVPLIQEYISKLEMII